MKKIMVVGLFLCAVAVSGARPAHASLAVAQKNACMACHAVDKKVVGPAYKDIAAKYKGKVKADALAKRIKAGGSGKWGAVPMPAQTRLSDADAKILAQWILNGAK